MAVFGYARISRPQQNIDRQIRNILKEYPEANIQQEAYTGRSMDRPVWKRLFRNAQEGDVIVFDSVSRMSRTADDGVREYFELYDRGINLVFLKEHAIDTDTYKASLQDRVELTGGDEDILLDAINKYLRVLAARQIRLAFEQSQKEVDDLRQRTREGLQTARINGKQIGRAPGAKYTTKKETAAKEIIHKNSKDFCGSNTDAEVMLLAGISRNTYYKYKRELTEQLNET